MTSRIAAAVACLTLAACASHEHGSGGPTLGTIVRKDPRFDQLIPPGARM
jgi:hypothetical protein